MLQSKYKPTNQKSLFHKDVVNHIRKWIQMIENCAENKKSVKQGLFLYGPTGCSKTVTVECLFKGYNLIEIDSDNIRTIDKTSDVLQSIIGFKDVTLMNIDKLNQKNKSNVVLIDNLELCDRGIENFIDILYNKNDINVPVILICNNSKYKNVFMNYNNFTILEFKKPSLLELTKLSNEICKEERINLSSDKIKRIVEKSDYDVRQLLFILEQWLLNKDERTTSSVCFEKFIESIEVKNKDVDLVDKLNFLFNKNIKFSFRETFRVALSEPYTLSCSIYQNYTRNLAGSDESLDTLENMGEIMNNISRSNILYSDMYENQNWNLYNDYTIYSTVNPSYYIKKIEKQMDSNEPFLPFKDISYNFMNSYEEVKKILKYNNFSKKYGKLFEACSLIDDRMKCFTVVKIVLKSIEDLNSYFTKNKKGKNTTKKEKLSLCKNISDEIDKLALEKLIDIVYSYGLFQIDIDDFIVNKNKIEKDIENNINKIDLRVFKRFLNIFTIDDKHKIFKTNIETCVQYNILQRLIKTYKEESENVSHSINNILVEDLDKIWNLN
jgi:DNA polymerase III delta prime subunit